MSWETASIRARWVNAWGSCTDGNGNLIFFWQDSSGNFHQEQLDASANLN
jgi:hypothetical protein